MIMNETEKKVFNSLSEEEQNKVAGGGRISSDDELTEKQCERLKNMTSGATIKEDETVKSGTVPPYTVQLLYGMPLLPITPSNKLKPQRNNTETDNGPK